MSFGDTAANRDMAEHIRVFIRLPVLRYALNRQPSSPLGEHESGIYVPNLCIPHKTIARSNAGDQDRVPQAAVVSTSLAVATAWSLTR